MKKAFTFILILVFIAAAWLVSKDAIVMQNDISQKLIRFHILANSDSPQDQDIKLQVKDQVVAKLSQVMDTITDKEIAADWMKNNLDEITRWTREALTSLGVDQTAEVSLVKEWFDTRTYDTFSLPAGMYDSLRITLGKGSGHNWWCVVFPSLCRPATSEDFSEAAMVAGFDDEEVQLMTQDSGSVVFKFKILELLEEMFSK